MSLHEELTAAQRCLDDLARTIGRLEAAVGPGTLEIRRVRTDSEHLRESLALLRECTPAAKPAEREWITVPDQPYDRSLWTDADDEGLGVQGRHAP
ncbi:hypothetical protein SRB5_37080 [Streptomyces sp. RB5]|uniref:Uncharacterized protein n=1 Tax=Streptomyces smaragdinus TaxID=2585196 RepID=A0A7K0CJA4_9ACTN|nr:hypothetical protein [Streptomyces smaragdinus]MQY13560.1 hypothetical protein [Streptomyces smaragdinus]